MTFDVDALLGGARGRRVCIEVAFMLTGSSSPLRAALFWAAYYFGGETQALISSSSGASGEPVAEPAPTAGEIAELITAVPVGEDAMPRGEFAAAIDYALSTLVDRAMYWQPPDGTDAIAATSEVRGSLVGVAEKVLGSPDAAWWQEPVDYTAQWSVVFDGVPQRLPFLPAAERLSDWRAATLDDEERAARDRPVDPHASWSGTWWSTPSRSLMNTTRAFGATGPIGLRLVEDRGGWSRATATRVVVPEGAAVYEIDGADAWVELCRRHPLDVTASRRHDWFGATGRDGRWVIPDWSAVAREWDAVHLTAAAYLGAAGRALPVSDDVASVIAGWDPDQTYWLCDVQQETSGIEAWTEVEDGEWRRPQVG
ncbi:MAG TPA: hypothetical protein VG369_02390 [Humibacter sp.]|nr:hypothetical protein [Humibacter sp.]